MNFVSQRKEQFDKVIQHLRSETAGLRTGRATPSLIENLIVEAYGGRQPLKAMASIIVTDPKTLTVEPWDKSILADVERAIGGSELGINPVNDGRCLRLPLPELTQERRQELIKILHSKLEQARITIRQMRGDLHQAIEQAEKHKELAEDEKFIQFETLDKVVKDYNDKVKQIGEEKEREINTV